MKKLDWLDVIGVYPFEVPPFSSLDEGYKSYSAFEPRMSAKTLEIHYDTLFTGYCNRLNEVIASKGFREESLPALQILSSWRGYDRRLDYELGGFVNHAILFTQLQPLSKPKSYPEGELARAIDESFAGGFDSMVKLMTDLALATVGSGWVWLVLPVDGRPLQVTTSDLQENPLQMDLGGAGGFPVIGIDFWEHAYFLDYYADKRAYVERFFGLVDWAHASRVYDRIVKGLL